MPTQLREATRVARKPHYCDMCNERIEVGESHHVSTNLFDGRVYDWRTCEACKRDRITSRVYDYWGCPDEGVDAMSGVDWAREVAPHGPDDDERRAARAFLERACTPHPRPSKDRHEQGESA